MGLPGRSRWNIFVGFLMVVLFWAWVFPAVLPAMQAASGTGAVSGRVVNLAGKPVKGAKVVVASWDVSGKDGKPKTWSTTTSANGTFSVKSLPAGFYSIEVLVGRVGQSSQFNVKPGKTVSLKFSVDASTSQGGVTGTVVVDAPGNARIIFSPRLSTPEEPQWFALPDAKGRFQIGLPMNSYFMQVVATGRDGVTRSHGRAISITSRKPVKVNIPLKASNPQYASIRGRLAVTAPSIRVTQIVVEQFTNEQVLADTRWELRFPGDKNPKSYQIANLPAGQFLVSVELFVPGRTLPAFYRYHRVVTLKERQSLQLNFDALKPPATVRGRIVDYQGKPLPFAQVFAHAKTANYLVGFGQSADQDGRFMIFLSEGTHRLVIMRREAEGTHLVTKEITVTVKSGQEVDLGTVRFEAQPSN